MTLPNTFVPPAAPNYQLAAPMAAYPYAQYQDDDNITGFFMAVNSYCQSNYVDFFNNYLPAVYTNVNINGLFLDWIGQGLYGIVRPYVSSGSVTSLGAYNTSLYNLFQYDYLKYSGTIMTLQVNDDLYKRCITWNFYRGDGSQFTVTWLKKRIVRWLLGVNGIPLQVQSTYGVSVQFSGSVVTITITNNAVLQSSSIPNTFYPDQVTANASTGNNSSSAFSISMIQALQILLTSGMLILPAQYSYVVVVG